MAVAMGLACAALGLRRMAQRSEMGAIFHAIVCLLAALLLGIADVAGKYYIPKLGAFIVYSLMIAILIWRPQGLFVRKAAKSS